MSCVTLKMDFMRWSDSIPNSEYYIINTNIVAIRISDMVSTHESTGPSTHTENINFVQVQ